MFDTNKITMQLCCSEWLIVISDTERRCSICGKIFTINKDGKIVD